MAQRILMYPSMWDLSREKMKERKMGKEQIRAIETSRRLMQRAAKEYKVMLQPIDSKIADKVGWKAEELYPLTNIFSLSYFNRLIYLPPSGLLLNADPIDLLFTLPMEDRGMLGLADPMAEDNAVDILVVEPSEKVGQEIMSSLPEGAFMDKEFLGKVHTTPAPIPTDGEKSINLLAETGPLTNVGTQFNATTFMEGTAYVRLKDEGLLGPEYATPRGQLADVMPREREARRAWEAVYERFREVRMNVCGLDLEPIEKLEGGTQELK